MSVRTKLLFALGSFFFLNSAFSVYQLNQFYKLSIITNDDYSNLPLPIDIKIEAILATILFIIGSLLNIFESSNQNKKDFIIMKNGDFLNNTTNTSIDNNKQTEVNKSFLNDVPLRFIHMSKATSELEIQGYGLYDYLENRVNFIDFKQKRREYSDWLNKTESENKSEK